MTKRPSLAESMKAMATPAAATARPEPPPEAAPAPAEAKKFHAATREGLKTAAAPEETTRARVPLQWARTLLAIRQLGNENYRFAQPEGRHGENDVDPAPGRGGREARAIRCLD
jgi:hypothetical protein